MRVRYAECDQQRVVFNAHYFAYFDVALTEVWRHAGIPYERMIASGTDMVVVEARARFHAPARSTTRSSSNGGPRGSATRA